jgi:hypothetical protein
LYSSLLVFRLVIFIIIGSAVTIGLFLLIMIEVLQFK